MFNWKKSAEADLKDYMKQKKSIKNLTEQIDVLNADIEKFKESSDEKKKNKVCQSLVLREKLVKNLELTKKNINLIDKGLSDLDDEQRKVLYLFYISGGGFRRVMDEFHIEQASAYRRKDEALRDFTIAMYGMVES